MIFDGEIADCTGIVLTPVFMGSSVWETASIPGWSAAAMNVTTIWRAFRIGRIFYKQIGRCIRSGRSSVSKNSRMWTNPRGLSH